MNNVAMGPPARSTKGLLTCFDEQDSLSDPLSQLNPETDHLAEQQHRVTRFDKFLGQQRRRCVGRVAVTGGARHPR
jgi:hypothetical protein